VIAIARSSPVRIFWLLAATATLVGCSRDTGVQEVVYQFQDPLLRAQHPIPPCTHTQRPCALPGSPVLYVPTGGEVDGYVNERAAATEILEALKRRDMATVARWAHPLLGVRFSSSGFVNTESDQVWTATELPNWFRDTRRRVWGSADHTYQDPQTRYWVGPLYRVLEYTPAEYFERYVFDRDFTQGASVRVVAEDSGRDVSSPTVRDGTAPVRRFYLQATQVIYILPAVPTGEYSPAGWVLSDYRVLRLVFAGYDLKPRLIGIVHDKPTEPDAPGVRP
jgi:hypothetical protein